MEKYLIDLFVTSAQEQSNIPAWMVKLYLSLFSVPLGKTLRIDMVKKLLLGYELSDKRILDVGCGIGDLSLLMTQRGANVIGVELDGKKVARANKIAARWHFDDVRFLQGDVTKLDQMHLGRFDVIFCLALLEHIKDDKDLLQQMYSMLNPGGLFIMEVPSARRKTIPEIEAEDGHQRPGYIYEEVPKLLAEIGFHVKRSMTMDPYDLIHYWCVLSRTVPGSQARGKLFAILAPIFIPLIRLTSALSQQPGSELCFLAAKD